MAIPLTGKLINICRLKKRRLRLVDFSRTEHIGMAKAGSLMPF
jgi:hypothetical protein